MTEQFIRDTAERFGLEVLKRVTTGNDRTHFATFELAGPQASVLAAWHEMKGQGRGTSFDSLRRSAIDGATYIELDSVWCELATV